MCCLRSFLRFYGVGFALSKAENLTLFINFFLIRLFVLFEGMID